MSTLSSTFPRNSNFQIYIKSESDGATQALRLQVDSEGGVKVYSELSNKNSAPSGGFDSCDPQERKCTEIVGSDSDNHDSAIIKLSESV